MNREKRAGRGRCKEIRRLVAAVKEAGGTVQRTANGHLKVTGPTGFAIVGSSIAAGRETARAWRVAERYTGLVLRR
jgi:hypothetical protein